LANFDSERAIRSDGVAPESGPAAGHSRHLCDRLKQELRFGHFDPTVPLN